MGVGSPPSAQSLGTFMLPFEAASVLLLIGIIAAVIIGRPEPASPAPTGTPRQVVEPSRR